MNGAADLIGELFGEKGLHARTAVGVVELPWGSPIEVELVVALNGR
jgi:enamine deaminase RidA (YjgF/YER057c/UK114 family)